MAKFNRLISRHRFIEKTCRQMFDLVYSCILWTYLQIIKFISIIAADCILRWYLPVLFIVVITMLLFLLLSLLLLHLFFLKWLCWFFNDMRVTEESERKSQRCELLNTEALICRCVYLSPDTFTVVINKQRSVGKSSFPTTNCYSKKKKRVKDTECPINSDLDVMLPLWVKMWNYIIWIK